MDTIHPALGLEEGGQLYVQALHLLDWGRTLRLACVYRFPDGPAQKLDLVFQDCRELKWRVYVFDDGRPDVALVDARLGRGGHRSPAQLLTDRFGLTLTYGELHVEHGDSAP